VSRYRRLAMNDAGLGEFGSLRREGPTNRVGALIMGWRVGELLQSIEGVK